MRKIIVLLLILPVLLFCGFKRKAKPVIILSANKITNESLQRVESNFYSKTRIFYALYAKDGFKSPGIRMQISKQDDNTSNWGFSIIMNKDIYIDMAQNTYRDYIYIQQPGHYIIQFFYLNNKDYPFAHREFRVH